MKSVKEFNKQHLLGLSNIIGCFFLIVLFSCKEKAVKSNTNEEVTAKSDTTQKYSTEKANEDSIRAAEIALKKRLEKTLSDDLLTKGYSESLKKSLKKEIRGTLESIVFELGNLIIWANLIREGEVSNDENKKLADSLRKKVIAIQVAEFPNIRKRYAEIVRKIFRESGVSAKVEGERNTIIVFSGGMYVERVYESSKRILKMLRFKKSHRSAFLQPDGIEEIIESPEDDELIDSTDMQY